MFSKFNLIYILLFVGILELPSVLSFENEDHEEHVLLRVGWEVRCKLQPNSWICYNKNKSVDAKFYYDTTMRSCKTFTYGGCDLAFNTFTTLTECSELCYGIGNEAINAETLEKLTTEVNCRLQHDFGSCFDYEPSYYYDVSTRTCKGFSYSGCGGNGNRFADRHLCMEACEAVMPKYKIVKTRNRK